MSAKVLSTILFILLILIFSHILTSSNDCIGIVRWCWVMFVLELTNCIILFYLVSFLLAIVHYLYMLL